METNESILKRQVLALDTRKRAATVKDVCVDANTRAVAALIATSATTGTALALPFEKTTAIGDTFVTIEENRDMVSKESAEAKKILAHECKLVGLEVYSRVGNLLGTIQSYEFDKVYGTITKIILDKKAFFTADQFVFFASDFVFVDDGSATAEDHRKGKAPRKKATRKPARKAPAKRATSKAKVK